jgi:hypothetical protein
VVAARYLAKLLPPGVQTGSHGRAGRDISCDRGRPPRLENPGSGMILPTAAERNDVNPALSGLAGVVSGRWREKGGPDSQHTKKFWRDDGLTVTTPSCISALF